MEPRFHRRGIMPPKTHYGYTILNKYYFGSWCLGLRIIEHATTEPTSATWRWRWRTWRTVVSVEYEMSISYASKLPCDRRTMSDQYRYGYWDWYDLSCDTLKSFSSGNLHSKCHIHMRRAGHAVVSVWWLEVGSSLSCLSLLWTFQQCA